MYYVVKTGNLYVSGFCPFVGTPDIKKAAYWEDKICAETIAVELGGVIVELKDPPQEQKRIQNEKNIMFFWFSQMVVFRHAGWAQYYAVRQTN